MVSRIYTCTHGLALNLHTLPKPVNTDSTMKTNTHNPLGNLSTNYEHDNEINLVKSKLDRFADLPETCQLN